MKKEFIPYEQALALKELGFNEPCFGFYNNAEATVWIKHEVDIEIRDIYTGDFEAPTFNQAFRWFREECGCEFYIDCRRHTSVKYYEVFLFDGDKNSMVFGKSLKYEEAELECLVKLIDIVKKQNLNVLKN